MNDADGAVTEVTDDAGNGALLAQQGNFMGGLRTSLLIAAGVALATAATSLLFRSPRRQLAAVTEPAVVDAESAR